MEKTELTLEDFGRDSIERMEKALDRFARGEGLCVVDDEDRENEGDLIFSAEHLTEEQVAQMIRDCSGIVCVCLTEEACDRMALPPMVEDNTNTQGTAFTVAVEAAEGVTTGVSAVPATSIRFAREREAPSFAAVIRNPLSTFAVSRACTKRACSANS